MKATPGADSNAQARRQIAGHLATVAGMETRALDAGRLQWIIDTRCRVLGLANAAAYAEHLATAPHENDALIDEAIVPETRFFRDTAVFHSLERWLPQIAATSPGPLHILSAPCGTGQEPYSLAATLRLSGVRPEAFSITAVDLSAAALAIAERGIYPAEALRRLSADRQKACGKQHGEQWAMHAALRDRIHFERANLAEPGVLGSRRYHLILCRNLFIYLRPQARRALAESLAEALLPGGRLILGTADHGEELDAFFAPLKPAAAFAYTHRPQATPLAAELPALSKQAAAALLQPRPDRTNARQPHADPHKNQTPIKDAANLYRAAIEHQQHGDPQRAEHRCRQALYLDPGFLPALELLEKLWLHLPDQRLRRALAARIQRNRTAATAAPLQ